MNIVTRDILVNLKYHTHQTGNENEIEPLTSENANVNHMGKILGGGGGQMCPVTTVAMLNREICITTVHLLLLVIKRQRT